MLEALSRLAPALLRHLFAYGELLREETRDAWRTVRRQAVGLAVAAAGGCMALLMGCVWVIGATWDGPNRLKALAALCLGFVLVALIGLWYAISALPAGQPRPFQRLRAELLADREELEAFESSSRRQADAPAGPRQEPEQVQEQELERQREQEQERWTHEQ
ncbi:MAG: hypothetical protein ABSH23_02980 [Steroidobacteraceae bacterium]